MIKLTKDMHPLDHYFTNLNIPVLNFDDHHRLTIGKFMWEISQNLHLVFVHESKWKTSNNDKFIKPKQMLIATC